MQEAIQDLGVPRLKSTRQVPSYKGQLTLGDPENYDTAICIDVERYPRVMVRKPLSASSFIQRPPANRAQASAQSSATIQAEVNDSEQNVDPNALSAVRSSRTYHIADEKIPGGKRDVNRDDLAKGYEYGRTAVHISESDLNVTKLETQPGLEIIGFIPWSTVSHQPHTFHKLDNISD